ncbi:hypothetical protein FQZ97_1197950 [compost metagenome]
MGGCPEGMPTARGSWRGSLAITGCPLVMACPNKDLRLLNVMPASSCSVYIRLDSTSHEMSVIAWVFR